MLALPRVLRIIFALPLPLLGACADTEFDRIYADSLDYWRDAPKEEHRSVRWNIEKERWRRGELGPNAPEPPKPRILYMADMDLVRMRFMERELIAFLNARCPDRMATCTVNDLRRLGFTCADAKPVACSLINTAYGNIYSPFTRIRERHVWTVTVAPGNTGSEIVVEKVEPAP